MLVNFLKCLKSFGLPVSVRELIDLLGCLNEGVVFADREAFYYLSRTCLIKDESLFDRFDLAFKYYFDGLELLNMDFQLEIPEEWLAELLERDLTEEQKADAEAYGDLDKLMEELRKRFAEQDERHEGGNHWIGTGGTSPFGRQGYNPEGVRFGEGGSQGKAVKVWEKREYRNLDSDVTLATRNIQMALRKLRRFAREGTTQELDMDDTITSTAKRAGMLDLRLVPERHNAVKMLLFMDVGGSMEPHVQLCERLFSATASEFKHLTYFYFHNTLYETVWQDNQRRNASQVELLEILRTYHKDYHVTIVGDAFMSPFEIIAPGGSIEHLNEEPSIDWLKRLSDYFERMVWLNPMPEENWSRSESINILRDAMDGHMYPLTLQGITDAIKLGFKN